ncbi:hypothetical protein MBLNU459_g3440t1 [Dothideomycetes sp. NU459]
MENLNIRDAPPPLGGGQMPPPVPQLPPQMFTTAAQLLDLTDRNLVLQDTVERLFAQNLYADVSRGLFLVRGENVLLLGEIDLDKDDYMPEPYEIAPLEQVFELHKQEQMQKKKQEKARHKTLATYGFEGENAGEAIL